MATEKKSTSKKTAEKKPAASKKKSVKKKAAPKKPATTTRKKASAPQKKAAPRKKAAPKKARQKRGISAAERYQMIREQAYYLSLGREPHFGTPLDDWLSAELLVDETCEVHD